MICNQSLENRLESIHEDSVNITDNLKTSPIKKTKKFLKRIFNKIIHFGNKENNLSKCEDLYESDSYDIIVKDTMIIDAGTDRNQISAESSIASSATFPYYCCCCECDKQLDICNYDKNIKLLNCKENILNQDIKTCIYKNNYNNLQDNPNNKNYLNNNNFDNYLGIGCDWLGFDSTSESTVNNDTITLDISDSILCRCNCNKCKNKHDTMGRKLIWDDNGKRVRLDTYGNEIRKSNTYVTEGYASITPKNTDAGDGCDDISPQPRHKICFSDQVPNYNGTLQKIVLVESYKSTYAKMNKSKIQPGEKITYI